MSLRSQIIDYCNTKVLKELATQGIYSCSVSPTELVLAIFYANFENSLYERVEISLNRSANSFAADTMEASQELRHILDAEIAIGISDFLSDPEKVDKLKEQALTINTEFRYPSGDTKDIAILYRFDVSM